MTHDTTDEPTVKASHPWAVLEGDTPLFHTPGTYPPEYREDATLEPLWRARHRPIIKYPGSKFSMSEWIIGQFPPHTQYLDPFFGSGIILMNKPVARHEVVNDLDDNIVNLFRVVRDAGEQLATLVEITPWARTEYELCKHEKFDDPVEQARRYIVQCWQGYGSSAGGRGAGWKNSGKNGAGLMITATWARVPERIRAIIGRFRFVEIEHRPAVEVIERYATSETLIYADPPYPKSTRNGRLYVEDYMSDADHMVLLDTLDRCRGPVVLSGYACPLYDERLVHWTRRTRSANDAKGQAKTECLWLNQVCIDRLGYGPLWAESD